MYIFTLSGSTSVKAVCRKKAAETTFVQNFRTFNVDEIDTWAQFHQRSTYSFYAQRSLKSKNILMT